MNAKSLKPNGPAALAVIGELFSGITVGEPPSLFLKGSSDGFVCEETLEQTPRSIMPTRFDLPHTVLSADDSLRRRRKAVAQTILKCALLVGAFFQASAIAAEKLTLLDSAEMPRSGTFYSMQITNWPPFPFHPFPKLPLYEVEKGIYVFDDRSVDYAELRKQSEESAGEGGGGMMMMMFGGSFGLKLTVPAFTNGYIHTTIYDHDPALAYDIYSKTNLNSTNWVFASWGVVGQTNYYLLQSSYPWNVFLMAASNVDTDGDGMPDNWEVGYGLNPNSAADAGQDPDGDGLTNWQEFQQGTNPTSAPTFQVLITSPRSILP